MKGGVNVQSDNDGDSSPLWFGEESPLVKKVPFSGKESCLRMMI